MSIVSGITPNGDVVGPGLVGLDKVRTNYFEQIDAVIPSTLSTAYEAANTVHTLGQDAGADGGNYTLTITVAAERAQNRLVDQTFTTGNLAHSANAATIETAINSAATTAAVVGWTNGDISVSGGALASADIVLTFDGASVSGMRHPVTVATDVDLTNNDALAVTLTTPGQRDLGVVQLLLTRGPMVGTDPLDPGTWSRNVLVKSPVRSVLDAYAWLATEALQSQTVGATILTAFGH